ncbi:MAG: hypothetical protein ACHQ1H_04495 [Nitrososphaerales archaeon]
MPDLFGNSKWKDVLDSWQSFADALPTTDREIFLRIIEEASQYEDGIENSIEGHDTEAFLLSILLAQQKKIQELREFIQTRKEAKEI